MVGLVPLLCAAVVASALIVTCTTACWSFEWICAAICMGNVPVRHTPLRIHVVAGSAKQARLPSRHCSGPYSDCAFCATCPPWNPGMHAGTAPAVPPRRLSLHGAVPPACLPVTPFPGWHPFEMHIMQLLWRPQCPLQHQISLTKRARPWGQCWSITHSAQEGKACVVIRITTHQAALVETHQCIE